MNYSINERTMSPVFYSPSTPPPFFEGFLLVDTETGTILNPETCRLVRSYDLPDGDASDSEICDIAKEYGIRIQDF